MAQNIFFVGPMGVGKTTIGRYLARKLNHQFYDSDREIESRTGVEISLIFDIEGEQGFRRRERKALSDLTRLQGIVLATGGGAVLDIENRRELASRGTVVYLEARPEPLYRRVAHDNSRPLLQTEDPFKRLKHLLEVRDPLYREVADIIVKTEERSVKVTAREIMQQLKRYNKSRQQKTSPAPLVSG